MDPRRSLALEEIDLADLDRFWTLPIEDREGAMATLRDHRPIAGFEVPEWGPFPRARFWAVTRYADVVEASRRPEDFCSSRGATTIVDLPESFLAFFGGMINADDPRHARLRRIVLRAFTPARLTALESDVRRRVTAIVDSVAERGACDFATDVAAQLPLQVICDMMGVPESQFGFVLAQTNAILGAADPEYVADEADVPLALLGAGAALAELMNEIGRERRANPTDDVTSALVTAEIDGEGLSPDELASFFVLLAVAGNETTRNAISWGMQALCDHPDQRRAWVEHFDQLAATAVEEIVRWASPVIFMRRTATRSALLSGHRFDEGDRILLIYSSANRDERVFRDPFRFDLAREENRHVGFGGFGPHYCLGAHLARQEITTMFRELLRRLPDLEVSGPPVRLRSSFINGVKHLPVTYSPSRLTG